MADFSEVVLQVNLAFVYSDSATSGATRLVLVFWHVPYVGSPRLFHGEWTLNYGTASKLKWNGKDASSEQYTLRSGYEPSHAQLVKASRRGR